MMKSPSMKYLIYFYIEIAQKYAKSVGATISFDTSSLNLGLLKAKAGYDSHTQTIAIERERIHKNPVDGFWSIAHELGHHKDLYTLQNDSEYAIAATMTGNMYMAMRVPTPNAAAVEILRAELEANRWAGEIIKEIGLPVSETEHRQKSDDLIKTYENRLFFKKAA